MSALRPQSCPLCSSERVVWQLYRIGGRRVGNVGKELHWSCRSCGHEWTASTRENVAAEEIPEISPTL